MNFFEALPLRSEVGEKELYRAVNILDKIDVKVISVVLNRVKLQKGKHYKAVMEKYLNLIHSNIKKVSK